MIMPCGSFVLVCSCVGNCCWIRQPALTSVEMGFARGNGRAGLQIVKDALQAVSTLFITVGVRLDAWAERDAKLTSFRLARRAVRIRWLTAYNAAMTTGPTARHRQHFRCQRTPR
jgi:hypothetical protein